MSHFHALQPHHRRLVLTILSIGLTVAVEDLRATVRRHGLLLRAPMGLFAMRWLGVGLVALLLTLAMSGASAALPKRVLILDSFGRDVAPFNAGVSVFRTTLAREFGEPVDIHEMPLEAARFALSEREGALVAFLKSSFEGYPLDLVVSVGAPAAKFAAQYRERLFPDSPILFVGVEPRLLPPEALRTNATLVTQKVNLPGMIEDILRLQPDTTHIVVVLGDSPLEKFWAGETRREFQAFAQRVDFTWLNDLSLDQIKEQVRALPPHSFILFGMFIMDAEGVPYDSEAALKALHAVANAPLFGYFASQFGSGAIGGRLYQDAEVGARSARAAISILRGERPESIPPLILEAAAPVYDWRELQRWGISEARLPAGSIIQFRQPTVWEQYQVRIVAVLLFCLLQTALITGLLISRVRQRRAEVAAHDLSRRLINAHEEARSRLARELHDDVTQRLAFLAITAGRIEQGTAERSPTETAGEMREGLMRLSEDVHALSYRLHPAILEDLGLIEALRAESERFGRRESVPVAVKSRDLPEPLPRQAALCLFRVAQEALRNAARHANARTVAVSLRGLDGGVQLAVQDDGCGFDPARQRNRPSLGLASMRERVQLLGGELDVESAPGQGTTILAWVPVQGEPE
ncbi:MAG: ATP-binding protein [Candidatus Competibacter sp.]|nr:ATP-binding protein [Candidatus Competibacter sp.]